MKVMLSIFAVFAAFVGGFLMAPGKKIEILLEKVDGFAATGFIETFGYSEAQLKSAAADACGVLALMKFETTVIRFHNSWHEFECAAPGKELK